MYCLVTLVKIPEFIEIQDEVYALAVGNKVASWSVEKYVPLRRYQKIYPEVEFYVFNKYMISEIGGSGIKFKEMKNC
jgi:hypothetical protein